MGFFNFLYKLSNIFTNKRRLKFFIVVGIVFLIIFGCSKGVFAATTEDVNALTNYQLALQQSVFGQLTDLINRGFLSPNQPVLSDLINNVRHNCVFIDTSVNNDVQFLIRLYRINRVDNGVVYNSPQDFTIDGSWEVGITLNNSSTEYPCKLAEFKGPSYTFSYGAYNPSSYITSVSFTTFYLPDACFGLRSNAVNDFLSAVNVKSDLAPTYSTSDEELQAITSAGFSSVNNTIQNQTNQMTNSISSASSSITNSIDSVENTLTDTVTDDEQVEFATESNNDVTSGFFTNLYTIIQNNFTANIYKVISFPIPFTNKTMSFSNDYFTNNIYMNQKYSTLVNLSRSCWWFSLGYYVILDIYKKINKLKSGDLTNIENENITTDLL